MDCACGNPWCQANSHSYNSGIGPCKNKKGEGTFIGNFCKPCFDQLTKWSGFYLERKEIKITTYE